MPDMFGRKRDMTPKKPKRKTKKKKRADGPDSNAAYQPGKPRNIKRS